MEMNTSRSRLGALGLACVASLTLMACDENGQFSLPTAPAATETAEPLPANAPGQVRSEERDVERPDIFETTDRALWDGRPSLGGVWVAHPDVQDPERVLIRNTENGQEIIGALFRRERNNPGPIVQVSSDAADALGVLAGAPVQLAIVALRREEVEVAVPAAENPVVASLEAPVNVEAAPLDPVTPESASATDGVAAAAVAVAPAAAETVEDTADATTAAATLAAAATAALAATAAQADDTPATPVEEATEADTVDVSAVFEAPASVAGTAQAQIGVFSNERNANAAAARIVEAGLGAEVLTETMGGQSVWRVVAGPLDPDAGLATLKGLGFVDAFILDAGQ